MPFGVDTSHVPDIPGLATVTGSTPVSGISDKAKDIMTTMVEDRSSLFANPMVNAITTANNSLSQLQGQLESIASGDVLNDSISAGDATTFLAGSSIGSVHTAMSNLLAHTNRLSGVLQGQGITLPGLEEIVSVGKQMNDFVNLLNAGSGCLSMIGGATGLFSQADLAGHADTIANLMNRISRGVATIADITETLANIEDLVTGIIEKDSTFLQNCVNQLKAAALAMGLEYISSDPCAKFILEQVSAQNPGGILNKLA